MNRKQFFASLKESVGATDLQRIQAAYWIAKEAHRQQARDCGERYFEHPRRTASILIRHGVTDTHTILIALLHDTLEDTHLPQTVILEQFGSRVLQDVLLLSNRYAVFDESTGNITRWEKKEKAEYYEAIATAGIAVRMVKIADRIDNLQSMYDVWPKDRQAWYRRDTRRHILPFAEGTKTGLVDELKELIG